MLLFFGGVVARWEGVAERGEVTGFKRSCDRGTCEKTGSQRQEARMKERKVAKAAREILCRYIPYFSLSHRRRRVDSDIAGSRS